MKNQQIYVPLIFAFSAILQSFSSCASQIFHISRDKIVILLFCQINFVTIFHLYRGRIILVHFPQIYQKSPVRTEKTLSQPLLQHFHFLIKSITALRHIFRVQHNLARLVLRIQNIFARTSI